MKKIRAKKVKNVTDEVMLLTIEVKDLYGQLELLKREMERFKYREYTTRTWRTFPDNGTWTIT